MLDRPQQRSADEEVDREQVLLLHRPAAGFGRPDGQQLAGVVPLVQGFRRGDALVALQPHEWGVEDLGDRLAGLRLSDARLALQEQWLVQPDGAEHRRRQPEVGDVVDVVERLPHGADGLDAGVRVLHHAPV